MWKKVLILFLLKVSLLNCAKCYHLKQIIDVVKQIYTKHDIKFDILIYGESSSKINDAVKEISKLNFKNESRKTFSPLKVIRIANSDLINLQNSFVIFIKFVKLAEKFLTKANLANQTPKKLRFLIYVEEENGNNLFKNLNRSRILYRSGGSILQFAYFLTNEGNFLTLTTCDWFTENFCTNESKIIILNKVHKKSKSWLKSLEIPEKFKNFHNCSIRVYVNPIYEGFFDGDFKGFSPSIARILAKVGNFSPAFQFPSKLGNLEEVPHVVFSQIATSSMKLFPFHVTSAYGDLQLIFILNSPPEFTNWEKVLLPFDFDTWIFLIITFGAAFGIILVVNPLPNYFKNLAFGREVQTPAFNVVSIFFGIGQNRLPNGNFPRIVLIFFIFFCLIIRTAYQGNFY
jgi:hypothetical protein